VPDDLAAGVPRVPASSLLSLPAEEEAFYHRVVKGDTLSGIARQYGVSLGQLLEANGLDAEALLQPDQLIFIPKGS
jgi:LysM repeat protein